MEYRCEECGRQSILRLCKYCRNEPTMEELDRTEYEQRQCLPDWWWDEEPEDWI